MTAWKQVLSMTCSSGLNPVTDILPLCEIVVSDLSLQKLPYSEVILRHQGTGSVPLTCFLKHNFFQVVCGTGPTGPLHCAIHGIQLL